MKKQIITMVLRNLIFEIFFAALIASPLQAQDANQMTPAPKSGIYANRIGTWDVVMTFRPTPDAEPIVMKGIAKRTMVDSLYLKEVMEAAPNSTMPEGRRISYLNYNTLDHRWEYFNLETRFPGVGFMSYTNFGSKNSTEVTFYIESFTSPGLGPKRESRGQAIRLRHVMIWKSENRDVIKQFWTPASGNGQEWLAVKYEYTRK